MTELYLYLFIAICVALLGWGLIKIDRIYQYPFFMGGIFTAFILPQAIALVNNPDPVSPQALKRVLLMSSLCASMCWVGYQLPPNINFIKKLDIAVDSNRLFYGGIVFVLVGYGANWLIFQLPEAVRETSTWTGVITIYAFFRSLIYPGLSILLLYTLQRPRLPNIFITAFAAILPLQLILFEGRREPTATFIITIGLSLYYSRRYVPPRWLVVSMILFTLLAIPLTGTYRGIAQTGDWNQLLELQPVEHFNNFVEEGQILELRNAALLMDASVKTRQYEYGSEYWNSLIFRFVPGQLVGENLKKSLQIQLPNSDLNALYNYNVPRGSTVTGIGDSFVQFDYLGCVFFLLLSYVFKNLWISTIFMNRLANQVFYVNLFAPAMISVTHGTVRFMPDLLFRLIFLLPVIIYARIYQDSSNQLINQNLHDKKKISRKFES